MKTATTKMTKAQLISLIEDMQMEFEAARCEMGAEINHLENTIEQLRTENAELHQRLDTARRVYKDLRAELLAARAEQPEAERPKAEQPEAEQPEAEQPKVGARGEKPVATFFDLKGAGEFITGLKERGAKVILTARRAPHGFVVWAKARV